MEAPLHPSIFETSVHKLTAYLRPDRYQPQERSWGSPPRWAKLLYILLAARGPIYPYPWFSPF